MPTATPGSGPSDSEYGRSPRAMSPRWSHLIASIDTTPASATKHELQPQTALPRRPPHAPAHSSKQRLGPSPWRQLRAIARPTLSALATCRRLIPAENNKAAPPPAIAADDGGDVPSASSSSRAPALRRSPRPPARSCHSSRRRARLGSCTAATAHEWRPLHAGLHSHCRALEPPAGDGSRRSATHTSRYNDCWPRIAPQDHSAAHASHVVPAAVRAPRKPEAAEHTTIGEPCR